MVGDYKSHRDGKSTKVKEPVMVLDMYHVRLMFNKLDTRDGVVYWREVVGEEDGYLMVYANGSYLHTDRHPETVYDNAEPALVPSPPAPQQEPAVVNGIVNKAEPVGYLPKDVPLHGRFPIVSECCRCEEINYGSGRDCGCAFGQCANGLIY